MGAGTEVAFALRFNEAKCIWAVAIVESVKSTGEAGTMLSCCALSFSEVKDFKWDTAAMTEGATALPVARGAAAASLTQELIVTP